MVQETQISERRAFRLIGMHRWTFRYPGKPRVDRIIRERVRELPEILISDNGSGFTGKVLDARAKIESWRQSYNTVRPHSSLNDNTPTEFAGRFKEV